MYEAKELKKSSGNASGKCLKVSYRAFFTAALLFLCLPVVIFFLGYLRPLWGILFTAVLATVFAYAFHDCNRDAEKELHAEDSIDIPVSFCVITILIAIAFSVLSGVGEYIWSTYDHAFRRAILRDLVDYKWPIVYDPATQANPEVAAMLNLSKNQGFVYYFTYWLPSAAIGKVLGFSAANAALVLWNSLGICLTMLGMCFFCKKCTKAVWFSYICFSGLDVIPNLVNRIAPLATYQWLEGYVPSMSLVSNYSNLANVYNQVVPCYLIVVLLLLAKNNRSTGLIGAVLFAYSPWATIGLLPIALYRLFKKDMRANTIKSTVTNLLSPGNLVMPVLILLVFGSFYTANNGALHENGFTWTFYSTFGNFLLCYLILILIDLVPIAGVTWVSHRKDPLYWIAVASILLFPLYKITEYNDFLMRGSMPALFVLCLFFCKELPGFMSRKVLSRVMLGLCMAMAYISIIMGFTAIIATCTGQEKPNNDIVSLGNISTTEYVDKIADEFFVEDYEESFFFKYLA